MPYVTHINRSRFIFEINFILPVKWQVTHEQNNFNSSIAINQISISLRLYGIILPDLGRYKGLFKRED